jgi:hypothetical protein
MYISTYQPYISKQIKKEFNTDISLLLGCVLLTTHTGRENNKKEPI